MGVINFLILYTVYADSSIIVDSITYLYGNVEFKDTNLIIKTNKAMITKNKVFIDDSFYVNQDSTEIYGNIGEYLWNKKINIYDGFFANKRYTSISGKKCEYFNDTMLLFGDICYRSDEQKNDTIEHSSSFVVYGEEGFYDFNNKYGVITKEAKFVSDSIEITGDTMKVFSDTLSKVINNAIIKLSNTLCSADSLFYLTKENELLLYGKPYIVSKEDSICGNEIKILLDNEKKINIVIIESNVSGKRWKF